MPEQRLIAHRGNFRGRDVELENSPRYCAYAIARGYDVEVDVWWWRGAWWFGHDEPQHFVGGALPEGPYWFHAKCIQAVSRLTGTAHHWFWHERDHLTLTSRGFLWVYPDRELPQGASVAVMPSGRFPNSWGVCADSFEKELFSEFD